MKLAGFPIMLFSFNALDVSANTCHENSTVHSDMVRCMHGYVSGSEELVEKLIRGKGAGYGIPAGYYESQRKSIHERCMIYSALGGQRAEVLELQCELDEIKSLFDLVDSYVRASDAN
jgi:hypothetical protein